MFCGTKGLGDFNAAHQHPLFLLEYACKSCLDGGAVTPKVYYAEMDSYHNTFSGVSGGSMEDRLYFNPVLLIREYEADKCGRCAGVGHVGDG